MQNLMKELRRREVFRTAGLYVGICWIVIEVSSVFLPAFEAPEWILRALIIAALVGFPIMIVLAWVYDVTDKGVIVQDEATDTAVIPPFSRKGDFVVIGVLSVALVLSLYMNFRGGPTIAVEPEPVSVLIADFENRTGNPLFDGSLEQALSLGIEGASFITAFPRNTALSEAETLTISRRLDEETARLLAVRQDVKMVLAGSIAPDGAGFELELHAVNPASGELIADSDASASSAAEVLMAINELAVDIRKALGEDSLDLDQLASGETVTAASIEALKHYTEAQDLARAGRDEEAIEYYEKAVEDDPEMARAYSGWGLSAYKIGRATEADEKWQKALSLLDRMTERERYRTLGLYYTAVSLNYDKAIENYEQLVRKFPADGAGNNNLAILYTYTAQYERALEQSTQLLRIFPNRTLYHANHAQYAIYAGRVEMAKTEAEKVLAQDPDFFKSYMILALAALHGGDATAARAAYERMAETGDRGQSLATIGLADIEIFEGRTDEAIARLQRGIEADNATANERGTGTKTIALAQAYAYRGDGERALAIIEGLAATRGDGQLVPSAEVFAASGQHDRAFEIAEQYRRQLRPTARAYANLIDGLNAYYQGEYVLAVDSLRAAIEFADLWLVRYYLGQAYLAAGYPAEALAEFDACIERRSEAGGLFFDDVPTWRYTAALPDWRSKASDALMVRVAPEIRAGPN